MHEPVPVRRTLGFLLRDTARLMRRRFVQRAREVGLPLNRSEASVLVWVDREPGLSQARLAARLDMEAISLVRLIDSLQEAGLIERRLDSRDRRIRNVVADLRGTANTRTGAGSGGGGARAGDERHSGSGAGGVAGSVDDDAVEPSCAGGC